MLILFQRTAHSKLVEAYRGVGWVTKTTIASVVLILVTWGMWQVAPGLVPATLVVMLVLLGVIHVALSYPNFVKVVIVWTANIMLITSTAILAALTHPVSAEDSWVLVTWVSVQALGGITITLAALIHPRGKVWLTLAMSFLMMFFVGVFMIAFIQDSNIALLIAVASGFVPLILRTVFPMRESMRLPVEDIAILQDMVENLNNNGFHSTIKKTIHGGDVLVAVNNHGQVITVDAATLDAPLTVDHHRQLRFHGKPLAGWLAQSIIEVEDSIARGVPFTHFVIFKGDNSLAVNPQYVRIVPRNGGKPRVVGLVSHKNGHSKIIENIEHHKPDAATKGQIEKLRTSTVA